MLKKKIAALSLSLFLIAAIPVYAESESKKLGNLLNEPVVSIDVNLGVLSANTSQVLTSPQDNVMITIFDAESGEKVYQQELSSKSKNSVSNFSPKINKQILSQAGEVVYGVYEAYFVTESGKMSRQVFSVPFVKDIKNLTKEEIYEVNSEQHISLSEDFQSAIDFKEKLEKSNNTTPFEESYSASSTSYISCDDLGYDAKICVKESIKYSSPTKIGSMHLGVGEKGSFNFLNTAKTKVQAGLKYSPAASWTLDGSVSVGSSLSTGVDFNITGAVNNYNYYLYANYGYHYQVKDHIYQGKILMTPYTVTPTGLLGGAATPYDTWINSNNGKKVSEVTNHEWGYYFVVSSTSGTTHSYETNRTISAGTSVVTPAGTFSASVTTDYINKHEIKYSSPNTNTKYYHYDIDNSKTEFFVTK